MTRKAVFRVFVAILAVGTVLPGLVAGTGAAQQEAQDSPWWREATIPGNPPNLDHSSMASFPETKARVVLVGHHSGGIGAGMQTWVWDGLLWSKAGSQPPPSENPVMAFHPDSGKVVRFGLTYDDSNNQIGVTWTWDGSGWEDATPENPDSACQKLPEQDRRYPCKAGVMAEDRNGRVVFFERETGQTWTWDGLGGRTRLPRSQAARAARLAARTV